MKRHAQAEPHVSVSYSSLKWKGYGEDRNSWEPWEHLLTEAAQAECRPLESIDLEIAGVEHAAHPVVSPLWFSQAWYGLGQAWGRPQRARDTRMYGFTDFRGTPQV